jgi:hypothetical protein
MENSNVTDLMLKTSPKTSKLLLENKLKREDRPDESLLKNKNKNRKWKPYKYLNYDEKRRLSNKESDKDHLKHVRDYLKLGDS